MEGDRCLMPDGIVVQVKNLSKVYKLYDRPIDRLKESLHPFRRKYHREFHALNDVSFEIFKGETLGIIGKNGAGKSTLLKIITGVLTPSKGEVSIKGKISALLELGAGFNPEFTGIENIYMNGTILGYSKCEMDEKLENILNFADIGDYVYQPVKMYSSGMFARLAFSVAINVDPDILIVDEALSVGDIAFQYKCFQRMNELKAKGVTLIIVSHSTQQILQHCDRALLLDHGNLLSSDCNVKKVVIEYEKIMRNLVGLKSNENFDSDIDLGNLDVTSDKELNEKRMGTYRAIIKNVHVSNESPISDEDTYLESGHKAYLDFTIYAKEEIKDVVLGVSLRNREGIDLWVDNNLLANQVMNLEKGLNKVRYEFIFNLVANEYLLCCGIATFSSGEREDLDQRWPIKKIAVISTRTMGGVVYAPISVKFENSRGI